MNTRLEELLRGIESSSNGGDGMESLLYGDLYLDDDTNGFQTELVKQFGGEGQGDQIWAVFKFTEEATGDETHIRFDGWYASYVGSEYDSFCEVRPIQVTKTEYERV